jgi:hypothetical protein
VEECTPERNIAAVVQLLAGCRWAGSRPEQKKGHCNFRRLCPNERAVLHQCRGTPGMRWGIGQVPLLSWAQDINFATGRATRREPWRASHCQEQRLSVGGRESASSKPMHTPDQTSTCNLYYIAPPRAAASPYPSSTALASLFAFVFARLSAPRSWIGEECAGQQRMGRQNLLVVPIRADSSPPPCPL